MQLNPRHRMQKGRPKMYNDFSFAPSHGTFATLRSWMTLLALSMLETKELPAPSVKQCHCLLGTMPIERQANHRDVAIIFHAHCLNPFRFFADMNRRAEGLWKKGIAFPLERLYILIADGVWSDTSSEQMWMGSGKSAPYQLWNSDPASGGVLQLQDPRLTCPWCSRTEEIPLDDFSQTHTTKTALSRCRSCGHAFNADTLSAKYLQDDILEFIKTQNGWSVQYLNYSKLAGL